MYVVEMVCAFFANFRGVLKCVEFTCNCAILELQQNNILLY